ncbi:hypothetical protein niasHT_003981 [Heterodera trifolii]|uniref:Uncharacterized protein n=1 Tax=Heterodera trifolii TaxID=157864 RepID=A0ABD2M516_9BILA
MSLGHSAPVVNPRTELALHQSIAKGQGTTVSTAKSTMTTAVAVIERHSKENTRALTIFKREETSWTSILLNLLKGIGGIGTFILDLGKDIIKDVLKTVTEKLIDHALKEDCDTLRKRCSCGWGACHPNRGGVADACCVQGYSWKCCENAKQIIEECMSKCSKCGWGECHVMEGAPDARDDSCCKSGYAWRCCSKAPPIISECQKQIQQECPKNCTWIECHESSGTPPSECCTAGFKMKCCEKAPVKLNPCAQMKQACHDGFFACLPFPNSKGDQCCQNGFQLKCGRDVK